MRKLAFKIILFASFWPVLLMSCSTRKSTAVSPLRVSWWSSQRELYAYVIHSAASNRCQVAVFAGGSLLDGSLVEKSLPDLLALVKTAHKQVEALPPPNLLVTGEVDRVWVSYDATGRESFSVQGEIPDLLKTIHEAPALEELLLLLSRDQPKSYRMLDEPSPDGQFMKRPAAEKL